MTGQNKYLLIAGMIALTLAPLAHADGLNTLPMDQKDNEVLRKIPADEMKQLNGKLRQAMSLYYDHAYPRAIILFEEIAKVAPTLDVLYWLGSAAYRNKQSDLAIATFKQMLARHDNLPRVRLDLALAYLQKGDKENAKLELQNTLASNPPPQIKTSIEQQLAAMEPRRERVAKTQVRREDGKTEMVDSPWQTLVRVSGGIQYDSNANAQPDRREHATAPASFISPEVLKDVAFTSSLGLESRYDLGAPGEWGVLGKINYARTDYMDKTEFDYDQLELAAGPEYVTDQFRVAMPMGVIDRSFAHDRLSYSWFVAPDITYAVNDRWDARGNLRYEDESYYQTGNASEDNHTVTLTFGPSWKMTLEEDSIQVLSLTGSYAMHDARTGRYTYHEVGIGPSYFAHYSSGVEAFMQARYQERHYDDNVTVPGLTLPSQRDDDRLSLSAMVSKTFMDKYVLSGSYTYTDNSSNTSIYEYDKHVLGLNLSVDWNL